jgi:GGDEF domain-containing protein
MQLARTPGQARPLAELPVEALSERAEELAKGWLLALLEREPLASAPSILAADLVTEGPGVCQAVLRALAADADLERLERGGAMEPLVSRAGTLAGGRTPEEAARAVDLLEAVIWTAVLRSLPDPNADDVARLSERLSLVVDVVRGAALRAFPVRSEHLAVRAGAAGDVSWRRVLEDEVARARDVGAPMSLLLVELEDADRLIAAEPAGDADATIARFSSIVRRSVRPGDVVSCEAGGRAWVIAVHTGRSGAVELASRLGRAVQATALWRGAPLRAIVGVAVLGEDGSDAEALIAAAEEARFDAAAAGIEVSRADREHDFSED